MTWLVAFHESGVVRDALLALGIDAVSCDLEPCRRGGPHIQGDAFEQLRKPWDGVIASPVCDYLTNAGVRWLYGAGRKSDGVIDRERWAAMERDAKRFRWVLEKSNAPVVIVENSIMHGHAVEIVGRNFDFSRQPWQEGDPFTKRNCFWLRGDVEIPPPGVATRPDGVTAKCHRMAPGPDRKKLRSETEPGIARMLARMAASVGQGQLSLGLEAAA